MRDPTLATDRRSSVLAIPTPVRPTRRALPFAGSRVEERRGVAYAIRFPSPLIKPDVPISGIRLSDGLHLAAVGGAPR